MLLAVDWGGNVLRLGIWDDKDRMQQELSKDGHDPTDYVILEIEAKEI